MRKNNLTLLVAVASLGFASCSNALSYANAKDWVNRNYTQTKEITPIKAEITWNFANSSGKLAQGMALQYVTAELGEDKLSGQKVADKDLKAEPVLNGNTFETLFVREKPNPNPDAKPEEKTQKLEGKYTFKLPSGNFYANWSEIEGISGGAAGLTFYFKASHAQTYKNGLLMEDGWKINYGYLDKKDEDGTENILKAKIVTSYTYPEKN